MTLTSEEYDAAIRLGRRQRAEQGISEEITDQVVLDRLAQLLLAPAYADEQQGAA